MAKWIKAKAVRIRKQGRRTLLDILTSGEPATAKRRNVAAGYYDEGVFHPIRASYDYDPARVGEKKRRRRPKGKRRR